MAHTQGLPGSVPRGPVSHPLCWKKSGAFSARSRSFPGGSRSVRKQGPVPRCGVGGGALSSPREAAAPDGVGNGLDGEEGGPSGNLAEQSTDARQL